MTYTWNFTAPAEEITVDDGNDSYTYTGAQIPLGGYSYTSTDFEEDDPVTVTATGYETITTTVGAATLVMTEMAEVSILNGNSTNYLLKDPKARKMIEDIAAQIYADLQNYVDKSTAQTISNTKTFTADQILNCRNLIMQSATTKGTAPASTEYTALNFVESGNTDCTSAHRLGNLEFYVQADGWNKAVLRAYENTSGSGDNAQIWVGRKSDGTNQTYAPTCTATNSIVTTTTRTVAAGADKWGFGNGFKVATATLDSNTGSTDKSWSYGITFTAKPVVVITRRSGASTTNATQALWIRGDIGTSSAKIYCTTSSSSTFSFVAIAIGH